MQGCKNSITANKNVHPRTKITRQKVTVTVNFSKYEFEKRNQVQVDDGKKFQRVMREVIHVRMGQRSRTKAQIFSSYYVGRFLSVRLESVTVSCSTS